MLSKSKRLKKELTLFNVYAIATGATLSSGFFLLPGFAAAQAGPAVVLSYLIAAIPLIPAVFSMAELSTAMPRAGGVYYFLDRSMGPLMGTIGGLGTWLVLNLKTAFALIGMGAYISLFLPGTSIIPLAVAFAVLFGFLNLFGAKKTGALQGYLVLTLLSILFGFVMFGLFNIKSQHFAGFFEKGMNEVVRTAGLVYISYIGITKIASVSEEVQNPERNLPLGMLLALLTAIVIYGVGTYVMVGVLSPAMLHNDFTPVATTAKVLVGQWGAVIMSMAAILAFLSVTNAAILSASRYPLAMSRDHLLPRFFRYLSKHRTPKVAIYSTVGVIILFLTLLDATKIAKLASAFQLLLFALSCLAVIIMRESRIDSYDPGYRSPFYPYMQILGVIAPLWLIVEMSWYPKIFTIGLVLLGSLWYVYYAKNKVAREGAMYHIFARLGERRFVGLDRELRTILKEKGLRKEDPFDIVIAEAGMLDISESVTFEDVVKHAAACFVKRLPVSPDKLMESFMQGTRVGATPVSRGVALPHMRLPQIPHSEMVIVRTGQGVHVTIDDEFLGQEASKQPVYAFFFLISPEDNPGQHLRLLAQIAGQVESKNFKKYWLNAKNEQEMKELLLRDERFLSIRLNSNSKSASLIGKPIRDLKMPEGSLIALLHRDGQIIFPRGSTILKEGDRLTIIGEPKQIYDFSQNFS